MKRILHALRFVRALGAVALALCAAAPAPAIQDSAKFPFKKGVNLKGLEDWILRPSYYGYIEEYSTYTNIQSKGFDHVRLPVYLRNYYSSSSQSLTSSISTIDGILDKCEAHGLYVFLDFHGWEALDTSNASQKAEFLKIWELVADHYKDRSDHVIFELLNEPRTDKGGNLDVDKLNELQAEVLPLIRAKDPNRLVLLAVAEMNGAWNLSGLTIPENPGPIGVVCHMYSPLAFTHQGAWGGFSSDHVSFTSTDKTATGTKDIDDAFRWIDDFQEKTGIPVVINEFGVNKSGSKATDEETLDWTSYVASNCESTGVPWTWWEYNKDMGVYYNNSWRTPVVDGLFPAQPAGNTYASSFNAADYAKRLTVSFPGYAGGSALADFPVLVKLSTAIDGFSYADFQRADGDDLRFTDAAGNLIPHEIDTWNPNGVSTVWVRVPSLTAPTTITAHYGCALPVEVDSSAVWSNGYVGVWHLGEGGLPLRESSKASTDFTKQNGSSILYAQAGAVGGAVDFGKSGNRRMLSAHDCDALDGFSSCTVEAWTYQTSNTTAAVLSKRYSSSKNVSYCLYHNGSKTQFNLSANGSSSSGSAQLEPTLNIWSHQAYTFDSGTIKGYLNGAKTGSDKAVSFPSIASTDGYLHLGNFNRVSAWDADARNFPGKIDEVRISNVARSEDWIQATRDTVAVPAFATYTVEGFEPSTLDVDQPYAEPPAEAGNGPLDTNQYAKVMAIRFDGIASGVTLTDFPVLVRLSTAIDGFRYDDFARSGGGDLRFTDAEGNLLPHEIDTWDPDGVSTVWVKVPRLVKNQIISAHYGYTGAGEPAAVDPEAVWDEHYLGVWHLGETSRPLRDSSGHGLDFIGACAYGNRNSQSRWADFDNCNTYGTNTAAVGCSVFIDAKDHSKNGGVIAPDEGKVIAGLHAITCEIWAKCDSFPGSNQNLFEKRATSGAAAVKYTLLNVYYDKNRILNCQIGLDDSAANDGTPTVNTSVNVKSAAMDTKRAGQWNYHAFEYDNTCTYHTNYLNGAYSSRVSNSTGYSMLPGFNSSENFGICLGNDGQSSSTRGFDGALDELRISDVARSAEWIKATNDTIADPAFATYAVGGELPDVDPPEVEPPETIDFADVKLKAATDKENPIDYVENEPIRFDFRIEGFPEILPENLNPAYVIWKRTGDDGVKTEGTNTISAAEGFSITTSLAVPGLVRIEAYLAGSDKKKISYTDDEGKTANVTFSGGAGVATEKVQLTTVEPADFDSFWSEAKAKLATVPFDDTNVELVDVTPSNLANSYTVYAAKIPCYGPSPVTGWLTIPKNAQPGSLSVRAVFDGYGCITKAPNPPTSGSSQQIRFQVNAHGYDLIGQDDQYYKDLYRSLYPTDGYSYGLDPAIYDDPETSYFYYMALRVVRAFDYLKTRPEWDGQTIIAEGGSQGGLQTMWAGGLVDGITQIKPAVTWGCDIGCPWEGNEPYPYTSRHWGFPCVPGALYFDAALHAKRVPRDCYAQITRIGMGDYTCPPRGVLLSFYNLPCAGAAKLVQGSTHGYTPPAPNQTFTIFKEAAEEEEEPSEPPVLDGDGIFGEPIKVDTSIVGTKASALAIEGTTLYCGVSGTLYILDVSDPLAPRRLGTVDGLYHIRQIAVENGLVAISSRSAGAWLINATTPTAPRILSHFETIEQATGIDIAGNFMAIGQRTAGVEMVDITDRANPRHIRVVKTQESQSCRYEDGILYSGDWHSGMINAIDVTDFAGASIVGAAPMQGYGDGFDLDGRYLYASTGHHRLLNGSTSREENYGHGHGLEIWDRSDVSNLTFVSRVSFDTFYKQGDDWWSCQEADGWVFCSDTHNGLYAVDARDPANPRVVDRFTDPNPSTPAEPSRTVNSVVVGDGAVYTTTAGSGLWVIPCAVARYRVRPRGTALTASNLAWREPYATAEDSHFRAWKPPVLGPVHSVAAHGGVYYAGCGAAGAYIVEAATLRTVGSIPGDYARDVVVRDGTLYIAQGDDGLGIYSLADPLHPQEVRRITKFGNSLTRCEWVVVPTSRWAIVHARCETGSWWFLDLEQDRTTYPSTGPSVAGMTWVRAFADGLVGGKWLGYTHTHYFPKWFDLSGDTPVMLDTENPDATGAKSSQPNYIESGTCTPISGDRLLIANKSTFTLLEPAQDHNADGTAWPTFQYANTSALKPLGLCWWDGGKHVGLASNQGCKIQLADFTDPERPDLEWQEDTAGNPEIGSFAPDGRLLVPCGYQGMLVEKRPDDIVIPDSGIVEAPGYDWTNRLFTVTGLAAGQTVTLSLAGGAGASPAETFTATADADGAASFDVATAPGSLYRYEIASGGETIGAGSFLAGAWDADGAWFSAAPDGAGGSAETGGAWTAAPAATNATRYALAEPTVFALGDAALAAGEGRLFHADFAIRYAFLNDAAKDLGDVPTIGTLAAITAVDNGGTAFWKAFLGGAWVALDGDVAPATDTDYIVRLEGDFTGASPRVRLLVSDDGGENFAPLRSAATGDAWFAPATAGATGLSGIDTVGEGSSAFLRGTLANADVAEVGGVRYATLAEALAAGDATLLTNVTWPDNAPVGTSAVNRDGHTLLRGGVAVEGGTVVVDAGPVAIAGEGTLRVTFGKLASVGVATTGRTPVQIAADLATNGANGIPRWQSLVLGLDAADSTSLPLANIAVDAAAGRVAVSEIGLAVDETTGATVTYRVYEIPDLAHPELDTPVGNPVAPGEPVTLPMGEAPSRFFHIKVSIQCP